MTRESMRRISAKSARMRLWRNAALSAADELADTKARLAEAVGLLTEWDALIKFQYTGSREAMSDLTFAAQSTFNFLAKQDTSQ